MIISSDKLVRIRKGGHNLCSCIRNRADDYWRNTGARYMLKGQQLDLESTIPIRGLNG